MLRVADATARGRWGCKFGSAFLEGWADATLDLGYSLGL